MHDPSWELYGVFLAVMREGSLTGAADTLGLSQPTVRRRIAALEASLGRPLFSRAPNGLVPTEIARRILPHAEAMQATARALVRTATTDADRVEGTVRISASEVVGVHVLPPILRVLRTLHPGLQVELALSDRNVDLLHRDADVAVRMATPTTQGLVARRIGAVPIGFFAAPSYLDGRAPPRDLADLRGHDLIGEDRQHRLIAGLERAGLALTPDDFALRVDGDVAHLAAIRAGLGIGVCQEPLAQGLTRVLPDITFSLDFWLLAHEDLRGERRIRATLDHLAEGIGTYLAR